ncbi:hypothetical protein AMTR_s00005p00269140 [Amborella trichopoda]|uniref:Signal peptidase complex subunit 3 n=1 Tax=Amborella trichopoda TaxID=13333 RepID=W1PAP9_AMBTC|nr:hypothetical protein AMTR_s00005p00269140 [Amborella trichopoda]
MEKLTANAFDGHKLHTMSVSPHVVFVFVAAEYITVKNSLNQISLWDHIIPSRDRAILQTQTKVKYPLTDQGNHLRGKYFNLTLHWHVMPNVGRMIADKIVMPTIFSLPKEYH